MTRILGGAFAVAMLAAAGCGGSGSGSGAGGSAPNGQPVDGKTFTIAIGSDPGSLDPHMTVLSLAIAFDRYLYDPLLGMTEDGAPALGLAEKWEGTTTEATFTLRAGVKCPDGSQLTARDVAANITFVGDPKNKSPMAGIQVVPGTTATGDDAARTVKVTSPAPDPFLLRDIGGLPIACGKGLADRSTLAKGGNGTGMYAVAEAVSNDHYTLRRRGDYYAKPAHGVPDKVVVKVVPNETTAANLLLAGELNAVSVIGPDRQRLLAQKLFHVDVLAPVGELFFNQAAGHPGEDLPVRRALVQALDLDQLTQVVTGGTGTRSKGMITIAPKACSGDTVQGNLPGHDLAAAKSTLDSAGWAVGAGGVRAKAGKRLALTVLYGTQLGPTMVAAAELVQQTWRQLGVQVTLKGVDSPGANQALFGTGTWDVSMAPLGLPLPNQLMPFVSGVVPPQGTNFGHIHNAEYDRLVKQAAGMAGAAGCASWNAAESALIRNLDVVPYADSVIPGFAKNARFELREGSIVPSSIRMYG
jgi:peptide/nickel transport system substrate-binding protein